MNAAEITALINLAATLAPSVLEFVNNAMKAVNSGTLTMADIETLQAKLSPMKPVAE